MIKTCVRIIAEEISLETNEVIKRDVIADKVIVAPKNIMDLGMRHLEQIELIQSAQDVILKSQSKYLDDGVEKCQECSSKLIKNGHIKSEFFSVFTDHKVPVQRKVCSNTDCGTRRVPSVYSMFGTTIHPELAKIQSEFGADESYRKAEKRLSTISVKKRKINNHDRIADTVNVVGASIAKNKQKGSNRKSVSELIIQIDGGHIKDKDPDKRSFEAMTAVVYRPDSVVINMKRDRGEITHKSCAASALDDNQITIKNQTKLACKDQGISTNTDVTAVCDGASNCWSIITSIEPMCGKVTRILDWFHIAMKFQNISLPSELKSKLLRIKWHLWRGNTERAMARFQQLIEVLDEEKENKKVTALCTYIENNRDYIVDYRKRKNNHLIFTSNVAESNVESLINQRCKGHQHMKWTRLGAHYLLQIRAAISNFDWDYNWESYVVPAISS